MHTLKYVIKKNEANNKKYILTSLFGKQLLTTPLLNKGTAFSYAERKELGLLGKLPPRVETLEEQVQRVRNQFSKIKSPLQKYVYLTHLHDQNEILFYKFITKYLSQALPIIYTPTVGLAVKEFSHEFRQPRGLYIAYHDMDKIEEILDNRTHHHINIVLVTDGERVLGIGDQGIGAIDIPLAKLKVYSACGGVNPYHTIPIILDVGTNNMELLQDPFYLGLRHPRIVGENYDEFINKFVKSVKKILPDAYIHWEDFGRHNARRLLYKYREEVCSFNDDLQGTAVVTLAVILSALHKTSMQLEEFSIVIYGAGTAGVGIADFLCLYLKLQGINDAEDRIWLFDKDGLISENKEFLDFQKPYVKSSNIINKYKISDSKDLLQIVKNVKPEMIIGCSSTPNAFTKDVIIEMAKNHDIPIIMPLSNPNNMAEANPQDVVDWTDNKCLIATGSPFLNVRHKGKLIRVPQCNNAYVFPGIGLGVIASKPKYISDTMLISAAESLAKFAYNYHELLPPLSDTQAIAISIAKSVSRQAIKEKLSDLNEEELERKFEEVTWAPEYMEIKSMQSKQV